MEGRSPLAHSSCIGEVILQAQGNGDLLQGDRHPLVQLRALELGNALTSLRCD
ncbi:MAG TPA: hypothetical protein V6D19_11800 [Stenomitos sp.]